jgi:carbon-monoxide dehydrogenase medium subunit
VALTGVSTKPTLALATMTAFRETDGSDKAVAAAAARAAEGVTIIEDLYGSVEYKRHLATVLAKRALLKAVGASR